MLSINWCAISSLFLIFFHWQTPCSPLSALRPCHNEIADLLKWIKRVWFHFAKCISTLFENNILSSLFCKMLIVTRKKKIGYSSLFFILVEEEGLGVLNFCCYCWVVNGSKIWLQGWDKVIISGRHIKSKNLPCLASVDAHPAFTEMGKKHCVVLGDGFYRGWRLPSAKRVSGEGRCTENCSSHGGAWSCKGSRGHCEGEVKNCKLKQQCLLKIS